MLGCRWHPVNSLSFPLVSAKLGVAQDVTCRLRDTRFVVSARELSDRPKAVEVTACAPKEDKFQIRSSYVLPT
jgi:hypothetical protein